MIGSINRRQLGCIIGLLVLCVALSSCEPLRKKFTRRKKQDAEVSAEFTPVLEPQDYPAPENDPVHNYKEHYDLIKAWYRDLWTLLTEKNSEKRQLFTLNQVTSHIEEMKKLVTDEPLAQLQKLEDDLSYYRSSLEQPQPMRNISRIQSDLRSFDRLLRDHLRFDKVKNNIVHPKS